MMSLVMFIFFIIGLAISLPIGVATGIASIIGILTFGNVQPEFFFRTMVASLDNFPILAVPLFMLAGELMSRGGIARQLFEVAHKMVGKVTGGHAVATVLTCMFFGAISGSGPAAVAAIGSLMIPMMSELGYDRVFATALVAASGGLGVIIPPSIPMVMFGVVTGVSVSDLFLAGVLPGIVTGIFLMIYAYLYCKITKPVLKVVYEEKTLWRILNESKWALLMPVIILGGIYGGFFTPTEAAALSVLYALIISVFLYKTIKLNELWGIFLQSAATMGPLMIIVSTATVFGRLLTLDKAPVIVAGLISNVSTDPIMVLAIINLFLLFVGAIMDTVAAILILAPILLPIAVQYGCNPIHFGIIMTVNLAIGFITPPIGMNLYVASGLTGLSLDKISRKIGWPFGAMLIALVIITYVPALSLVLLGGK